MSEPSVPLFTPTSQTQSMESEGVDIVGMFGSPSIFRPTEQKQKQEEEEEEEEEKEELSPTEERERRLQEKIVALRECQPTPGSKISKAAMSVLKTQSKKEFTHNLEGRLGLQNSLFWGEEGAERLSYLKNLSQDRSFDVDNLVRDTPPGSRHLILTGHSPKDRPARGWLPVAVKQVKSPISPEISSSGELHYRVSNMGYSAFMDGWCREISTQAVQQGHCPHFSLTYARYVTATDFEDIMFNQELGQEQELQSSFRPTTMQPSSSSSLSQLEPVRPSLKFVSIGELPRRYKPLDSTPSGPRITLYRFLERYRLDKDTMNILEWRNLLFHVISGLAYLQQHGVFLRSLSLHDVLVLDSRSPSDGETPYYAPKLDTGDRSMKNLRKHTDQYILFNSRLGKEVNYYIQRGRFTFLLDNYEEARLEGHPDAEKPSIGQDWAAPSFVGPTRPHFPYSDGSMEPWGHLYNFLTARAALSAGAGAKLVSPRNNALQHFIEDLLFSIPPLHTLEEVQADIHKKYEPLVLVKYRLPWSCSILQTAYETLLVEYLLKPITDNDDKSAVDTLPLLFNNTERTRRRDIHTRGVIHEGDKPTIIRSIYDLNPRVERVPPIL